MTLAAGVGLTQLVDTAGSGPLTSSPLSTGSGLSRARKAAMTVCRGPEQPNLGRLAAIPLVKNPRGPMTGQGLPQTTPADHNRPRHFGPGRGQPKANAPVWATGRVKLAFPCQMGHSWRLCFPGKPRGSTRTGHRLSWVVKSASHKNEPDRWLETRWNSSANERG
jgi:hypothetical protein